MSLVNWCNIFIVQVESFGAPVRRMEETGTKIIPNKYKLLIAIIFLDIKSARICSLELNCTALMAVVPLRSS